jgi:hypothetical protein
LKDLKRLKAQFTERIEDLRFDKAERSDGLCLSYLNRFITAMKIIKRNFRLVREEQIEFDCCNQRN